MPLATSRQAIIQTNDGLFTMRPLVITLYVCKMSDTLSRHQFVDIVWPLVLTIIHIMWYAALNGVKNGRNCV